MLAAAWLGRGFWGLLRGAGRRRAAGGTRPLAAERGGGRHGDGGVFCLAAGAGGYQRLLRAPAARLLSAGAGAGPRRAGSGGAGPPDSPLPPERRVAGRCAELVGDRGCVCGAGGGGRFVAVWVREAAPPLRGGGRAARPRAGVGGPLVPLGGACWKRVSRPELDKKKKKRVFFGSVGGGVSPFRRRS